MFITLTNPGGLKIRVNTDKIIEYSVGNYTYQRENSGVDTIATDVKLQDHHVLSVKETPDEIDEILRVSFITVYNR